MGFLQRLFGRKANTPEVTPQETKESEAASTSKVSDAERAQYFDGLAENWDQMTKLSGEQEHKLADLFDHFGIPEGSTILDVGCGTGVLYKFLAPRIGAKGRVYGVDLSSSMIARAEAKFAHDQRFSWHVGSGESLLEEISGEGLDRVVCFSSFPHFSDKKGFLQAAAKALRPGGKLAIIHLGSSDEIDAMHSGIDQSPVAGDKLPNIRDLAMMAQEANLAVQTSQEKPGLYFFVGASLKRP